MSAWETKDIIVVASAVSGFAGTVVVQLLHPVFAARRERAKIVENPARVIPENTHSFKTKPLMH